MSRRREREPQATEGLHLGRVTRVDGAYAYVEVLRLARGYEYGPAGYPSEYAQATPNPLTAGDKVAVAFLEGGSENLVILSRLA